MEEKPNRQQRHKPWCPLSIEYFLRPYFESNELLNYTVPETHRNLFVCTTVASVYHTCLSLLFGMRLFVYVTCTHWAKLKEVIFSFANSPVTLPLLLLLFVLLSNISINQTWTIRGKFFRVRSRYFCHARTRLFQVLESQNTHTPPVQTPPNTESDSK